MSNDPAVMAYAGSALFVGVCLLIVMLIFGVCIWLADRRAARELEQSDFWKQRDQ